MENQHRKIKGYRELNQMEIDLMNRIKVKGAELLALQAELDVKLSDYTNYLMLSVGDDGEPERLQAAEPFKWSAIGKTNIQTGIMALVRAVAQPEGC